MTKFALFVPLQARPGKDDRRRRPSPAFIDLRRRPSTTRRPAAASEIRAWRKQRACGCRRGHRTR